MVTVIANYRDAVRSAMPSKVLKVFNYIKKNPVSIPVISLNI